MSTLSEYIMAHSQRGACTCGRCADAPTNPEQKQPKGHVADLIFFKVSAKDGADADELRRLISEHEGEYGPCDLFDGNEHGYIEIGGFVGDQGLAMQLMGLGTVLGLFDLLTPRTVMGADVPDSLAQMMAQSGMVGIMAKKKVAPKEPPPPRTGITKTRDRILEEIKAGRKSQCMDSRDYLRLGMFFPAEDLPTLGFELKPDADLAAKKTLELNRENILTQLGEDLSFAFEKAIGKRGLSAGFMYEVVKMWMWVLDDDLQDFEEYEQYGLPFLKAVALKFGFPNPIGEDDGNEDKYAA